MVNTRNIHHGLFNFTLHMKEKMPRSYFDLEVYTLKKKNSVRAALHPQEKEFSKSGALTEQGDTAKSSDSDTMWLTERTASAQISWDQESIRDHRITSGH